MNWVFICSIAGGAIVIASAFAQIIKEKKDSEERLADKNEIIKLHKESNSKLQVVNDLQAKINDAQAEINDAQRKLADANEKIMALTIEQMDYQSGGDSYPYVHILKSLDDKNEEVILFAVNKVGKNPLYDVNLMYWDLESTMQHRREDGRATLEALKDYTTVNIGTIDGNGSKPITKFFKIDKDGLLKINLSIHTRNGSFSQVLRIAKKAGDVTCAYRVTGISSDKTPPKLVRQHIDKDFPRNAKGNIDWD